MTLDFSRCRLQPFAHQREDVAAMLAHPFFFIASEMRTGKTKIVIDAAQFMFEAGIIEKVLVAVPAPVRDVWFDNELGELAKHLWTDLPAIVQEFHARYRAWTWPQPPSISPRRLSWLITNYEFIRSKNRLTQLLPFCGQKTLLVLDESSYVKNWAAQQTKACLQLRRACGRVVLLNGTPIFHSPLDLFSQSNILHPSIIDCKYVTHFKARYAIQQPVLGYSGKPLLNPRGGGAIQTITGWTNLDDLQRRFAPYTVRRMQADCLDLPPKLDAVTLTATLTPETWRAYKSMRDELVVWLKSGDVSTSATAAVRVMRLAQITSGFLGGIEDAGIEDNEDAIAYFIAQKDIAIHPINANSKSIELGREKLDVLLWFLRQRLEADPKAKVVAWCRFRAELFRVLEAVEDMKTFTVGSIHGGQKKAERLAALRFLNPETSPDGPVFVGGTAGSGSFGLNFTASHTCVTLSSDYSPGKSAQMLDRVYGPGQTQPIAYYDVVAVGPRGQKTIDHAIIAARRAGQDVATWTSAAWIKALTEE